MTQPILTNRINGEPFPIEYSEEWSQELERGYESYMFSLLDGIDDEEDEIKTISGEPFCGCDTCMTRETLTYLIPRILDAHEKGLVVRSTLRSV
jgi:hypothetical protein